tara:strand:+ start:73 stop:372 length:300 start_codon:yes stop_codon:yes gene_type:complete
LPFGDDEFAHISGEELCGHTDETLKLLLTSLRFDAVELREETERELAKEVQNRIEEELSDYTALVERMRETERERAKEFIERYRRRFGDVNLDEASTGS